MKKQKVYKPGFKSSPGKKFNGNKHISDLYDESWRRYSKAFLAINKDCYACGKKATEVDHIRPHKGDVGLFKKLDNHLPMCNSCHSIVTAKYDRDFGPNSSLMPKLKWISNKRLLFNITTRVKVLSKYED